MYYYGPPGSGKTGKLVNTYVEMVQNNESVESILVICASAYQKKDFISRVKEQLYGGYPLFRIHSYHGVIYNTIKDFWPLIEKQLKGNPRILPDLSGLETCEFLLKECVRAQNKKNKYQLTFDDFYGDRSLITQLIRRYRLMSENMLDFEELLNRSNTIGQKYALQANESLKCLKIKTSRLRVLDFVSQMNAFNMLLKDPVVKNHFSNVKHLIVDDLDESMPACQHFISYLLPGLKSFTASYDPDGGTRRGYLSAYPAGCAEILSFKDSKKITMTSKAPLKDLSEKLFKAIKLKSPCPLEGIRLQTEINRVDMLEEAVKTIDHLLSKDNVTIEDIIIVTPVLDNPVKATIENYCCKRGFKWQFFTGSSKPIDNPRVAGAIILLQLINSHWGLKPSPFDIRLMMTGLLNFPPLVAEKISEAYQKTYKQDPVLPNILLEGFKKDFRDQYESFLSYVEHLKTKQQPLYDQMVSIFTEVIVPDISEDESVEDYNRVLDSLRDFSALKKKLDEEYKTSYTYKDWVLQVKNEHVAETPVLPAELKPETLAVITPLKLVDMQIESKYQIWLDVSSNSWTRTQTAPLYNAWAYSGYFDGSEYNDDRFTRSITAHAIRAMLYRCQVEVYALASTLDSMGNEQQGWLIKYLSIDSKQVKPRQQLILREDQVPILEYNGGTMAVAAVPGSGKTFVNVALIAKLIEKGANPESILVLTYMESAAQTLINRIRLIFPELTVLPVISTIHGLAYKIIRDDNNSTVLGLNDDTGIADDSLRSIIVGAITETTRPEGETFEYWYKHVNKGISTAKSLNIKPEDILMALQKNNDQYLKEFYKPYLLYKKELKHRNLIDFDDQIQYAIMLLDQYPEIRKKYQETFQYIIEDEAQDSTRLQQKLLSLLVNNNKNYVRTGDINQAIMTTFTPVDVEGFRRFINTSQKKVTMDQSQRCSRPIYTLANKLIQWAKNDRYLKNAFLDITIKPVEGRNPENTEPVKVRIFKDSEEEKTYIAREIQKLQSKIPAVTCALLLRTNKDALKWTHYLTGLGFKCICFTDNAAQNKVFSIIHKYLKVIYKPFNNTYVKDLFIALVETGHIIENVDSLEFINNVHSPFITFDIHEIPTSQLVQYYMDILYWLEYAGMPPAELILKLTEEIFDNAIDRSNGYLLSITADRFRRDLINERYRENFDGLYQSEGELESIKTTTGLPDIIKEFDRLSKTDKVRKFRFFEKEDSDLIRGGYVQVMTIHKAKGMGFDAVFIPHIWENSFYYTMIPENVRVDTTNKLEQQLEKINEIFNKNDRTKDSIIMRQLEETIRLLYVAITRAKSYLYLTSSYKNSDFNRDENPSRVIDYFISLAEKEEGIIQAGKILSETVTRPPTHSNQSSTTRTDQ
jgi:DNA helicase-2/ATP-dependent DNA helicase PcrA